MYYVKTQSHTLFVPAQKKTLHKVALLHNTDRLHFLLSAEDADTGKSAEESGLIAWPPNTLEVRFKGGLFGSFSQWVVFDFGRKPVLVRKLNVELGKQPQLERVKQLRERVAFER